MSYLQEIICMEKKNGKEAGMRLCIAARNVKNYQNNLDFTS
jgi:hypothetical protein